MKTYNYNNSFGYRNILVSLTFLVSTSISCQVLAEVLNSDSTQQTKGSSKNTTDKTNKNMSKVDSKIYDNNAKLPPRKPAPNGIENGKLQRATFGGGCFWCMEKEFQDLKGVKSVTSGYTGGKYVNPSYITVSSHSTDQVEAIDVIFDPKIISYRELVDYYWQQIDPTDDGGQFVDRGSQYKPYIWVHNEQQRKIAIASKNALIRSKRFLKPIVVPIVDAVTFWPAEEYHQDFCEKKPQKYTNYRLHSGRDKFYSEHWKGAQKSNIRK